MVFADRSICCFVVVAVVVVVCTYVQQTIFFILNFFSFDSTIIGERETDSRLTDRKRDREKRR